MKTLIIKGIFNYKGEMLCETLRVIKGETLGFGSLIQNNKGSRKGMS